MFINDLEHHLDKLASLLAAARRYGEQLVLIVGGDWRQRTDLLQSAATAHNLTYLSLGLPLSRALMDLPPRERPLAVESQVVALAATASVHGLALDHVEILFDPDQQTDPLRLFERLAQERLLLVSWPGEYDGQRLTYAEPSHRERYLRAVSDIRYYSLEVTV
jgi:hypothetical protein